MKRLLASVSIIMLITTAFVSCYFKCSSISVYADGVPDGYSAGANDQVDAFKYYCKSRNLAIEGSVLDAVTQVTTKAYQSAVTGAGFDMNQLQNEIYKSTGAGQNFFFTASGITAMNRIFAEFLQNNNLSVGDEVNNQEIYSGRWFVDADGNGCQVATTTSYPSSANVSSTYGTTYIYTWEELKELVGTGSYNLSLHLTESFTYNYTLFYFDNGSYTSLTTSEGSYNPVINWGWAHKSGAGHAWYAGDNGVCLNTSNGKLYFGYYQRTYYGDYPNTSGADSYYYFHLLTEIPSGSTQQANVYLTTNNTTINNNNYEGDTIINNEGDIVTPQPLQGELNLIGGLILILMEMFGTLIQMVV